MELNRNQAVDLLHTKGYSRRMSAKLADIALLKKSNRVFELAVREAVEKARSKAKK